MFEVLESIFGVIVFVTSIYLIISGVSKKEKYLTVEFIKKRNLIFGILLIVVTLFSTDWNNVKNGIIDGQNAGSDVRINTTNK